MHSTTPFPSEMRPVPTHNRVEDAPKSPFETLATCETINRIITDLTDRLDPVLVTEAIASGKDSIVVERPKATLLSELERIAFRLRCLDQRITL